MEVHPWQTWWRITCPLASLGTGKQAARYTSKSHWPCVLVQFAKCTYLFKCQIVVVLIVIWMSTWFSFAWRIKQQIKFHTIKSYSNSGQLAQQLWRQTIHNLTVSYFVYFLSFKPICLQFVFLLRDHSVWESSKALMQSWVLQLLGKLDFDHMELVGWRLHPSNFLQKLHPSKIFILSHFSCGRVQALKV